MPPEQQERQDRRKGIPEQHAWKYELLILFLGAALVFVSAAKIPATNPLNTTLVGLGIAVMAGTFLSLLELFLDVDVPSRVRNKLTSSFDGVKDQNRNSLHDVKDEILSKWQAYALGLEAVYPQRHEEIGSVGISERIKIAKSLDMLYCTAINTLEPNREALMTAIENGCKVQILYSNPKNPIWENEDLADSLSPSVNVPSELRRVEALFKGLVQDLNEKSGPSPRGSLDVRKYLGVPTCSILIIDEEIVRHTPYLPYLRSISAPVYDVAKRGGLFKVYQGAFNGIWGKAERTFVWPDSEKLKPPPTPPTVP